MKIVLLGDACEPDGVSELPMACVRGGPDVLRPGDFAVMPFDRVDPSLKKKHLLRAVLSCIDDSVARIRELLAKDVVVIGKATQEPLPQAFADLFGRVCYVKCNGTGHRGAKYLCTNDCKWFKQHQFTREHNRRCKVFFPDRHEKGVPVPSESPPRGLASFGSAVQYRHVREIKQGAPGWLSTGLSTAFHFVFEGVLEPEGCLYMFRFSHWRGGRVVTPPPGMRNAFGRPPGRHDVDLERRGAEHLQKTGRVFSLELGDGGEPAAATPEPPTPEPPRPMAARPAAAAPEPARPAAATPMAAAPEPARLEPPRPAAARPEPARLEPPRPAAARPAAARPEAARPADDAPLLVREDIARLIPEGGAAAELGVAAGQLSKKLLDRSACGVLYSIDSWAGKHGHNLAEYHAAVRLLKPYGERSQVIRSTFEKAAARFGDETLDLVYVDGYTDEDNGGALRQWWGRLRPGGVFAGNGYDRRAWPALVRDVDRFAKGEGLQVSVIANRASDRPENDRGTKYNKFPTWYFRKPERPPPAEAPPPPFSLAGLSDTRRAWCEAIEAQFAGRDPPRTMLDIGCGLALEAEYFHKKHGTRLWLVEGDAGANGGARTRTTGFGPAGDYAYAVSVSELKRSLASRGVAAEVLSPDVASRPPGRLPAFDLVLSLNACGMHFPVAPYAGLIRDRAADGSVVVLELSREHEHPGVAVDAVLDTRPNSVVARVRLY